MGDQLAVSGSGGTWASCGVAGQEASPPVLAMDGTVCAPAVSFTVAAAPLPAIMPSAVTAASGRGKRDKYSVLRFTDMGRTRRGAPRNTDRTCRPRVSNRCSCKNSYIPQKGPRSTQSNKRGIHRRSTSTPSSRTPNWGNRWDTRGHNRLRRGARLLAPREDPWQQRRDRGRHRPPELARRASTRGAPPHLLRDQRT